MTATIAFYTGIAAFIFCCIPRKNHKSLFMIAFLLTSLTAILLLINWTGRSLSINYPALTSLYEAFLFSTLLLFLLSSWLQWKKFPQPIVIAITGFGMLLLILCSSPLFFQEPHPPLPVLRSHWLLLHVAFSFMGEVLFALAFFSSLFYLFGKDPEGNKPWDKITYRSILMGYLLYTTGALIFGAIWASYAWGRFWGWDPKETWALITWLTYTLYLHLKINKRENNTLPHWISATGFIFTLITFLGLNLVAGNAETLHSY